ncbi:hypothetical protein [Marinilactibacillus psychrotolerans]|uniref:DUF1080 domain-containing protein n=1 Tax=Marinilactibacillus psychrotolerans TaxID=191770 RepID=A0AAV3WS65_9LACT|nr:hypothetical protein MPS01_16200 [Marinilactibacillus psychrotolerans]GEQ35625.1 hypothetical protein M132T_11330 [Marinilactibacillus psychrotolerans]SDC71128.1 hypothetical protein SAMN04488013_10877 [Marinilactibacillus psychrotolerans]
MTQYTNKINLRMDSWVPVQTFVENVSIDNNEVLRVVKDSAVTDVDEPTFARINDIEFQNGTIEVKVLSRLLSDAPEYARGFIGVAFRIDEQNAHFEGIYIRPTNGRSEDQSRRNSSTQYFSYPDYKFDRFREESPKKYESYADMGLDEWIDLKIEVTDERAKLYLNNSTYPILIVNDLKQGPNAQGGIGLWVDIGTEGFFKELRVVSYDEL